MILDDVIRALSDLGQANDTLLAARCGCSVADLAAVMHATDAFEWCVPNNDDRCWHWRLSLLSANKRARTIAQSQQRPVRVPVEYHQPPEHAKSQESLARKEHWLLTYLRAAPGEHRIAAIAIALGKQTATVGEAIRRYRSLLTINHSTEQGHAIMVSINHLGPVDGVVMRQKE